MSEPQNKLSSLSVLILVVVACFAAALVMAIVIPNFIRARSFGSSGSCMNNLRQMDGAKQQWALENHGKIGDIVTENDLTPYIKLDAKGNLPNCPQGGTYTIGKVGEPVTCSLGNTVTPAHVVP